MTKNESMREFQKLIEKDAACKISFASYVRMECERQWNECQAVDGYGKWHEQSKDTKIEFYNSMYEYLLTKLHELDGVKI